MRVVHRFTTGLRLTRDSLLVVRAHPTLIVFPLLSGLATLAFVTGVYLTIVVGSVVDGWLALFAVFGFYFGMTFLTSFFTAALVASATTVFHGREPTLRGGLAVAWDSRVELAVWSTIAAVVGLVLRSLERSDSIPSRVVGSIFALGWTVTTFFVVPVVVFEDVSVRGMFATSASTFKRTWGESLSSNFGIGLFGFVAWLGGVAAALVVGVGLFQLVPAVGTATAILGIVGVTVGVVLVGRTARGIVKTALYVYATEGTIPQAFADFDFETLEGRTEASTAD